VGDCARRALAAGLALALGLAAPAARAGDDEGADGEWSERRSSRFILLQDVAIDERGGFRGSVRFERELLDVLEKAHDRLHELLGLRTPRPIHVLVYDPAVFDAAFAGAFRFPAAGFYQGVVRVRGDTKVTAELVRTLHHELVHAAFDALAPSLVLPGWFNEGVAEWFEARAAGKRGLSPGERAHLQRAAAERRLFGLFEISTPSFGVLGAERAPLAYLQSYAMIDYLAGLRGERRLRELVRDTIERQELGRPFQRIYRFGLPELPERLAAGLGT
jgi:hypothetical protein